MNRPFRLNHVIAVAICFAAAAYCGSGAARADELQFAKDRPFDVTHIKLDLYLELDNQFVRSRARISGKALRPLEAIRFDAVGFEEVSVMTRGRDDVSQPCDFENDGEQIIVRPRSPLAVGDEMDIFIDYTINKPKSGLHFFAPSEDEPDTPHLVWSQGQSIDNRYWVPCFDHPNERQTTEIICTVATPYQAFSNGRLVRIIENEDDTRTFHWLQDTPHVSYLMTLVVGEFATLETMWRDVPVSYHAAPKHESKLALSFVNTPKMLEYFSEAIGVKYPWSRYAQICCHGFGGGMENTSATTLGERGLVDERGRLDHDPDGLIAHELAHQWYGDLLTCRDWAHIWLNEGFASYFEALWDEEQSGGEEFAYNMRGKASAAIRGGAEHPIVWRGWKHPDEQFDSRAYPKGAWVLHMIRRQLGDELFWKMMKVYTERYAYQTVETTDFRKTIEDVTGRSFERFFYDWTERPGAPEVKVTYKWLDEDRLARIDVEQTQKADAYHFPLKLEFRFGEGRTPHVMTQEIREKSSRFFVPLGERPKAFRIDPDQAVLMTLKRQQSKEMWAAMLSDENPSARLDAVDHFAAEGSEGSIQRLAQRLSEDPFWAVKSRIAEKLGEDGGETARDALLANVATADPRARRVIVEQLGEFSGDEAVAAALETIVKKGDPSYRVEAASIKAYAAVLEGDEAAMAIIVSTLDRDSDREVIRSAALEALGENGDPEAFEALKAWFAPEKPSECRAAALRAMGRLVARGMLEDNETEEVVKYIDSTLDMKPRTMLFAALGAAGDCGVAAMPAVNKIETLATEGHRRIRRFAKDTAEKIRKKQPESNQLSELRELIKSLQEANRKLTERLKKIEATAGRS